MPGEVPDGLEPLDDEDASVAVLCAELWLPPLDEPDDMVVDVTLLVSRVLPGSTELEDPDV